VRGQWDQQSWGVTSEERLSGQAIVPPRLDAAQADLHRLPVAALTRGSIRPAKALSFWRYAPPAQAELGQAAGCQLAMGLGEAPLVRQCTFSVWDDTESMVAYAHQGAHRQAIAAAQRHDFFSESMFARMQVLAMSGTWCGRQYGDRATAPLAQTPQVSPDAVPLQAHEVAHG
jgi:spheroidene monooxygenase